MTRVCGGEAGQRRHVVSAGAAPGRGALHASHADPRPTAATPRSRGDFVTVSYYVTNVCAS